MVGRSLTLACLPHSKSSYLALIDDQHEANPEVIAQVTAFEAKPICT